MPTRRPPSDDNLGRPTPREAIAKARAAAAPKVAKAVEAAGPMAEKAASTAGGLLRTLRTRAKDVASEFSEGYGKPDEEPGQPGSAAPATPDAQRRPRPGPKDR